MAQAEEVEEALIRVQSQVILCDVSEGDVFEVTLDPRHERGHKCGKIWFVFQGGWDSALYEEGWDGVVVAPG